MIETLIRWAEAGGPIVILLACLSVYAVTLAVMKIVQFWGVLGGGPDRDAAIDLWSKGAMDKARGLVVRETPVNRVVRAGMDGLAADGDTPEVREETTRLAAGEIDRLGRHLRVLEILAMVSPLLGLLGTVIGMIESFQQLELAKGSANAAVLAGGIWQALLTTAMGLVVAIPAAIASHLLFARLDRVAHAMEDAITRLTHAEKKRRG